MYALTCIFIHGRVAYEISIDIFFERRFNINIRKKKTNAIMWWLWNYVLTKEKKNNFNVRRVRIYLLIIRLRKRSERADVRVPATPEIIVNPQISRVVVVTLTRTAVRIHYSSYYLYERSSTNRFVF